LRGRAAILNIFETVNKKTGKQFYLVSRLYKIVPVLSQQPGIIYSSRHEQLGSL